VPLSAMEAVLLLALLCRRWMQMIFRCLNLTMK